ncbi:MAG TPA: ABC transporter ATP-binding protein, partial [Chitinophagaceae bacterium]
QFSKLESHLNELNQQEANTEAELADPKNYSDKNKFLELEERYKSVQQKLNAANKEYESLFEKIMQLESEG